MKFFTSLLFILSINLHANLPDDIKKTCVSLTYHVGKGNDRGFYFMLGASLSARQQSIKDNTYQAWSKSAEDILSEACKILLNKKYKGDGHTMKYIDSVIETVEKFNNEVANR